MCLIIEILGIEDAGISEKSGEDKYSIHLLTIEDVQEEKY